MASLSWTQYKISVQWQDALPDRFDPERAKKDVDDDGMIRDYENSYSMHHKTVEATAAEVKDLMDRFQRAEQGLIIWDEELQTLVEIEQPATRPDDDG